MKLTKTVIQTTTFRIVILALAYYVVALAGHQLSVVLSFGSPLWLASGLAISFVFAFRHNGFAAVALGALAALVTVNDSWIPVSVGLIGILVEALCGVFLIGYISRWRTILEYQFYSIALIFGPLVATAVGASIETLAVPIYDPFISIDYFSVWRKTWVAHYLGALVLCPVFIFFSFFKENISTSSMRKKFWTAFWVLLAFGLSVTVFILPRVTFFLFSHYFVLFFVITYLGRYAGHFWVVLVSAIAIWFTCYNIGPFVRGTPDYNLVQLQLFISSVALTALVLGGFKAVVPLKKAAPVLFLGWAICGVVYFEMSVSDHQRDYDHFTDLVGDATTEIEKTAAVAQDIIRGGLGLFAASKRVEPIEWQRYSEFVNVRRRLPGLEAFGLVRFGPKQQVEDATIQFLEPAPFHQALGLRLGADPRLAEKLRLAAESGRPILSDDLDLSTQQRIFGYVKKSHVALLLAPIFKNDLTFEKPRLDNLRGWILLVVDLDRLFNYALRPFEKEINLKLASQTPLESEVRRSHPLLLWNRFKVYTTTSLWRRDFGLVWSTNLQFVTTKSNSPAIAMIIGSILTLLVAGFIVNLQSINSRATALARRQTEELKRREGILQQIMNELEVAKERFDLAVRGSNDGLWDWDIVNNRIYFSSHFKQMFGYAEEEFKDSIEEWRRHVHPADLDSVVRAVNQHFLTQEPFVNEHRIICKDGSIKWVLDRGRAVFDTEGTPVRMTGWYADITERKIAEEEMEQQRIKMIEASKMSTLGEMAGGIAHEINNPLAVILGRASQIKTLLARNLIDKEKLTDVADRIEQTATRIAKIVKGLRAFARDGESDPPELVNIKSLVDSTLEVCRERFRFHGIELRVENREDVFVSCREVQISQVLLNLLNNAYDAVESLSEKWVDIQVLGRDIDVQIRVTDSGRGIAPYIAEKMMQPFFTTKEVGKGTGLGLSIAKGIVEEHGGRIFYDHSSPYTRFVVELKRVNALKDIGLELPPDIGLN